MLQHPTDLLRLQFLLMRQTSIQILWCPYEDTDGITMRIANYQKVLSSLTDIIHPPTYLSTNEQPALFITSIKGIMTIALLHQDERVASHTFTFPVHRDIACSINMGCIESLAIPPA